MEEHTRIVQMMKKLMSAKRSVETAIRMFGPTNITSILDRDTFHQKLQDISTKLEFYIQTADEVIEELEDLHGCEPETEIIKKVQEIDSISDAIFKKVNDNESDVKKKMEEIINLREDKKFYSERSDIPAKRVLQPQSEPSNKTISTLSNKIDEYCEAGPFLTHLPQFVYAAKYVMSQYQKKLPEFGLLLKPVLVGGAVDKTAGTLTAPDLDFNIEWELDEDLTSHLNIEPTDNGESGQYTVQIKEGHETVFKSLFRPFVLDIQNHGRRAMSEYVSDNINDAYIERHSKTYISSNLLRTQVGGLLELMKDGKSFGDFVKKDFSTTGAARTLALDVKKWFRECLLTCLIEIPEKFIPTFNRFVDESCFKILPELEVDYTPVLTVQYDQLPTDLKVWEDRESFLLDVDTRNEIKEARGCLVAKSLERDESRSSIIWRLSINSAPVMQKAIDHFEKLDPKCSVKKVLRIIKDIKNVALCGKDKDFLKSYNVKQAMLWCIHENPGLSSESELLETTLHKLIYFYQQKNLPSFLEPRRNLVFKMSSSGLLKEGEKRVIKVLTNVSSYLDKIKDKQRENHSGLCEVRNLLAPMAPILVFPVVSERISEKTTKGLNKDFTLKDGSLRFYFEDMKMVKILDKGRNKVVKVSERDALKCVIKNWVNSVLTYVTKKDAKNDEVINEDDEQMPSVNSAAIDLVHSIAEAFPENKRKRAIEVYSAIIPSLAEAIPAVNEALPEVTNVVNTLSPVIRDVTNTFKLFQVISQKIRFVK